MYLPAFRTIADPVTRTCKHNYCRFFLLFLPVEEYSIDYSRHISSRYGSMSKNFLLVSLIFSISIVNIRNFF